MIKPEKVPNALYALQGVLIHARMMAYEGAPHKKLAGILDAAEILPRLIASDEDETERFRRYVEGISIDYKWANILVRFDEPVPPAWWEQKIDASGIYLFECSLWEHLRF